MNLKTLELFGFKSFMRKLDIHFSDGITVIVGPNGCGKTNVTDALRWVLGESNARMLRGARMEDLIFNGTRDYSPLNVAEVSLTVDNSAGILPIEYAEVTVTRRVYRNGESEFLINKIPGRLKDIHDLFMDTGLGSRAYSVIERDMVEMVLADQPEKRRELLEEAAGIMKYKIRERQARRKLEATDEDLQRLQDVLHEVERQVKALKRQVGAAQRFQEVRERLRILDVGLAAAEVHELNVEEARLRALLEESCAERDGATARVAAYEADIESRRLRAAEADAVFAGAQRDVDARADAARRVESENLVRRERREALLELGRRLGEESRQLGARVDAAVDRRTDLDAQIAAIVASRAEREVALVEVERVLESVESALAERRAALWREREAAEAAARDVGARRAALANLESRDQHLADRAAVLHEEARLLADTSGLRAGGLETAEGSVTELRRAMAEIGTQIEARESRRREIDRERDEARESESRLSVELESARAAASMLQSLRDAREGFGQGARTLLSRGHGSALAEALNVTREDLLTALDASLGAAVDYVVAPGADDALTAVRSLGDGEGRATVIDRAAFASGEDEARGALPVDPSVIGWARDFLRAPAELAPVVARLLARTALVETLDDAVRLSRGSNVRGMRFVARSGDWAESGMVHGGAAHSGDPRILGRADRIAELERQVTALDLRRGDVRGRLEALGGEREDLSLAIDRVLSERDSLRERLSAGELQAERARAELAALDQRRRAIEEERQSTEGTRREIAREQAARQADVEQAAARQSAADDASRQREEALMTSSEDRERLQQNGHAQRLELSEVRAAHERLDAERTRLEEARAADEEGVRTRALEVEAGDRQLGELARAMEEGFAEFARLTEALEAGRRLRDEAGTSRANVLEELGAIERERARWSRLRDETAERAHDLEMRLARSESDRREIALRIEREFSVDLRVPEVVAEHGSFLAADAETREASQRERDDLKTQLDRMGAVNLVALDQYERESNRYEFLRTQRDDLEQAREGLRRTIRRINRKARALFMETLEQVRVNFQKTFGTLFEGGQADVRLIGDEDPLHAPIEIFARPRGKRLSNISLMSSGERSLTAVSFLFAIYLVKPSPFCILDEVDAPLDDANIGRFLAMLKKVAERTQFVMITHNKKTMEIADYLYGVTMEEPGISKLVSVRLGRAEEPARGNGDSHAADAREELVEASP